MNAYVDLEIPYPPMSKARPRVTAHGTYMPAEYTQWKSNVATVIRLKTKKNFKEPVAVSLWVATQSMRLRVEPSGLTRFGRQDIDNIAGSVMDAMQMADLVHNDSQVVDLHAVFDTEARYL